MSKFCSHSQKFIEPLHIGRPNIGSRERFLNRINEMFDRRWLSNDGPLVKEFEQSIASYSGVKHCITVCNATVGLQIAIRALELTGEVIIPSFTFVATAHALMWQGIKPVFADIDPATHNISHTEIERLITPQTSGIIGVHLWGEACDTDAIDAIVRKHGIKVMYDAAHAFGCAHDRVMVGNFGDCEVYSFHATKFLNSFEGGAIVTNNDELAEKIRLMRNFGFSGYDNVVALGINAKMSEPCAAMGLTSLESADVFIAINKRNHEAYRCHLAEISGIRLLERKYEGDNNYQYIVVEVEESLYGKSRDALLEALHIRNIIARKYFWPGCHNMEPYRSDPFYADLALTNTEAIAKKVLVLPTGETIGTDVIKEICNIISAFRVT